MHTPQLTLMGHNWRITDLAISPNGEAIASGSINETIQIWKISTGEAILQLKSDYLPVTSIAFNSDGALLATEQIMEPLRYGTQYPVNE